MKIATSEKEFIAAARDLQAVIRTGLATAKKKADMGGAPQRRAGDGAGSAANPLGLKLPGVP